MRKTILSFAVTCLLTLGTFHPDWRLLANTGYQNGYGYGYKDSDLGDGNSSDKNNCQGFVGDPINTSSGNVFEDVTDYRSAGPFPLTFTRFYNSQSTYGGPLGANWSHRYTAHLEITSPSSIQVIRPDQMPVAFILADGVWSSSGDVTATFSATSTGFVYTSGENDSETYDQNGRLLSISNRTGLTQTLFYDQQGRLTKISNPFGKSLTFSYDSQNRIISMVAPDNGNYAYGYDANNNLSTVTYPDETTLTYLYENVVLPNTLTGIIDENGNRYVTWNHDASNRAIYSQNSSGINATSLYYGLNSTIVTDAKLNATNYIYTSPLATPQLTYLYQSDGSLISLKYDSNNNITSKTDANGVQTIYSYDLTRNLETSRTEAVGTAQERTITTVWHPIFRLPVQITETNRITTLTYDSKGNLVQRNIESGNLSRIWRFSYDANSQLIRSDGPRTDVADITTYGYDTNGNLVTITDALGHVSQITAHDPNGRPLTLQDPNGLITQLTYDARGRLLSRNGGGETTHFAYDSVGQLVKVTTPSGAYLANTYDGAHRLTQTTDSLGNHHTYTLDSVGNLAGEDFSDASLALTQTHSGIYDSMNRLSESIGSAGQTTSFQYDANSNATSSTNPLNNTTTRTYDALNRLASTIDPHDGKTQYVYDANNNLIQVTDPRGAITSYAYDGLGNQTTVQSPDSGTTTRTFDAAGNMLTSTDARGKTTSTSYDALNRPAKRSFSDGTSISYVYDTGANGIGRLTTMIDMSGRTSWTYDSHGRVLQKKQKIGAITLTTTNTYNAVTGLLTSTTRPSGLVLNYQYDANGQVSAILAGATPLVSSVSYEPFGRANSWVQGDILMHTQNFDLDGRNAAIDFSNSAAPSGIESISLSFDTGSRIIQITNNTATPQTFDYDALDELTDYTGATSGVYAYDANGNRTQWQSAAGTTHYGIDTVSNKLLSRSLNTTTTHYSFDAAGNLINDGSRSFTLNPAGQLTQVQVGSAITRFVTNGFGERVQKSSTLGITLFAQDESGNITGEYNRFGAPIEETVYLNNMPVAVLKSGTWYYINPDHLGAPRTITTATGTPVWSWDHDPFGNGQPSGHFTYNLRFPGQYYDIETGLHYNNARYYDPATGRYIASDPFGLRGGINTYTYVVGNPLTWIDPLGLDYGFSVDPILAGGNGHTTLYFQDGQGSWYSYNQGAAGQNSSGDAGFWQSAGFLLGFSAPAGVSIQPIQSPPDTALIYPTTLTQDKKISSCAVKSQKDHNSGQVRYNLYTNNCTGAAVGVLGCAGISISNPTFTFRPNSWIKQLPPPPAK